MDLDEVLISTAELAMITEDRWALMFRSEQGQVVLLCDARNVDTSGETYQGMLAARQPVIELSYVDVDAVRHGQPTAVRAGNTGTSFRLRLMSPQELLDKQQAGRAQLRAQGCTPPPAMTWQRAVELTRVLA